METTPGVIDIRLLNDIAAVIDRAKAQTEVLKEIYGTRSLKSRHLVFEIYVCLHSIANMLALAHGVQLLSNPSPSPIPRGTPGEDELDVVRVNRDKLKSFDVRKILTLRGGNVDTATVSKIRETKDALRKELQLLATLLDGI